MTSIYPYSNGRPSSPSFLRLRVRPTVLASVAAAVAIVCVVFGVTAFLMDGASTTVQVICTPEVVLLTFMCVLLNQLYLRGHYCRFADKLGVSETLAFYFSVMLMIAGFVGTMIFSA